LGALPSRIAEEQDVGEMHALFLEFINHVSEVCHRRIVIIFDGFDKAIRRLSPVTFDFLRALAGMRGVAYVTASRQPISTACPASLTSGFSNIFVPIEVGCVSDDEARSYVGSCLAKRRKVVDGDAMKDLLEFSGGHPYLLRVAAYHLYEALESREAGAEESVMARSEQECAESLRHSLRDFDPHELTLLSDDTLRSGGAGPGSGRLHRMCFLDDHGVVRSSLVRRLASEMAAPDVQKRETSRDRVWRQITDLESKLRSVVLCRYRGHYGERWKARVRRNIQAEDLACLEELERREIRRRSHWLDVPPLELLDLTHLRHLVVLVNREWALFRDLLGDKAMFTRLPSVN
jgi:hypothetical protein